MKLFLKNSILFGLITLVAYPILLYAYVEFMPGIFRQNIFYKPGSYGHLQTRLLEAKQAHDVDLLFVGSSHAYRGFDTRIYQKNGFTSFNLGSSAQTYVQTQMLLERYLDKINPKKVLFEVYPGNLISDGVESASDILSNDFIDMDSYKMSWTVNHISIYNTLIYANGKQLTGKPKIEEPLIIGDDRYIRGGFVEKKISYFSSNKKYKPQQWMPEKKQIIAFQNCIALLKKKNIPYELVYMPVTRKFYESYTNNSSIDSLYQQYGNYHNLNKFNLPLNDSIHFYDSHHLNQLGVTIANETVIKQVLKK